MGPTNVADTLDRAADSIERRGWCRGDLHDESGRVCAYGAIYDAVATECWVFSSMSVSQRALIAATADALVATIGEVPECDDPSGDFTDPVLRWNDKAVLDQADVVNHFRKAVESVRAEATS